MFIDRLIEKATANEVTRLDSCFPGSSQPVKSHTEGAHDQKGVGVVLLARTRAVSLEHGFRTELVPVLAFRLEKYNSVRCSYPRHHYDYDYNYPLPHHATAPQGCAANWGSDPDVKGLSPTLVFRGRRGEVGSPVVAFISDMSMSMRRMCMRIVAVLLVGITVEVSTWI